MIKLEYYDIIICVLLGIFTLIAFSHTKKRDHRNIKKNLELKGFRAIKINPYINAFRDFPDIPGRCYYVSYEDKDRKAYIGYCFCSMSNPVTWVKN